MRILILLVFCTIFWACDDPGHNEFELIRGSVNYADINQGDTLFLGIYKGEKFQPVDTAILAEDKTYSFVNQALNTGVYEISIAKKMGVPLILTPDDQYLDFDIVILAGNQVEMPQFNKENIAFTELNVLYKSYLQESEKLGARVNELVPNEQYKQSMQAIQVQYNALQKDFNGKIKGLTTKYPGTYASSVMAGILYIPQHDSSSTEDQNTYLQNHFLDSIPFEKVEVITNPLLIQKLYAYLNSYSQTTRQGFITCINQIMSRASENKEVEKFILNYLVDLFLEKGPDDVVYYIYDNFSESCSAGLSEVTVKRIRQRREFVPGTAVPEIILPDREGNETKLYSFIGNAPVVIYFWASWCDHCQKETPEYVSVFNKYKNKGLQVFAVSLDDQKQEWNKAVKQYNLDPFTNVCDLKRFESPVTETFAIFGTPAVFLLDRNGRLIEKDLSPADLDRMLGNLPIF